MRALVVMAAITAAIFVGIVTPAYGHNYVCRTRDNMVSQLTLTYREAVVAAGLSGTGKSIIEIWRNGDGSTFTITFTDTMGVMCMLASGKNLTSTIWHLPTPGDLE